MATKIILKKSSTAGSVPLVGDLDNGELAVNLVDRKIYTNNGTAVVRMDGAYVDSVAPGSPLEGDIWYDTANNLLKAYNGSAWNSAGYQTLAALEDTTITSVASGDHILWTGSTWENSNFEADTEALFSAANTTAAASGNGYGDLSYVNGVYSFDRVTAADIRAEVSADQTAATLGAFAYSSSTGVFTYTGVTQEEIEDITGGQLVTNGTHTNITASYDDTGDGAIDLSIDDTVIRGKISVTDNGGDGSLSYNNTSGVITYTGPSHAEVIAHFTESGQGVSFTDDGSVTTVGLDFSEFDTSDVVEDAAATATSGTMYFTEGRARAAISVTDNGGDGALTYNSTTGVITYDGPTEAEVRAHISGGEGVSYDANTGVVSIGQPVDETDDVTFNSVETDLIKGGTTITIDPSVVGDNSGTVVIAGDLTVNGTTTTVSSNNVTIGDSILVLNADETGAPSQNAGFEVERGTSTNKLFVWNESDDAWDLQDETLQGVIIDGGSY